MKNLLTKTFIALAILCAPIGTSAQTDPGTANLKHRWTFENGSVKDDVGGLTGQVKDGAIIKNNALNTINGGWFEMPGDSIAVNNYTAFSQSIWFIPNGLNMDYNSMTWFGNTSTEYGVDYILIQPARQDEKCRASITCLEYNTPWEKENGVSIKEIDDQKLHNLVSVVDSNTIKLYLDGKLIGIDTLSANNKLSNVSTAQAWLAKGGYTSDPTWFGMIPEYSIYNKALSEDEVQFLFLQQPIGSVQPLVTTNSIIMDNSSLEISFGVTSYSLAENISIIVPYGITVIPSSISKDSLNTIVKVIWDGTTSVDGNILLSSGLFSDTIKVKSISNTDCFSQSLLDKTNLVPDPGCNDMKQFVGWGIKKVMNVLVNPENVYCGANSIQIGDGIESGNGSLDVNLNGKLKPNTTYRSSFWAKTTEGYAQVGVFGVDSTISDDNLRIFQTNNTWQYVEFYFKTGTVIKSNVGIYTNNWSTTNKSFFIDNWSLVESKVDTIVSYDSLPNYVPNQEINCYFNFDSNFNKNLVSLRNFDAYNIQYTKDRNGKLNSAIELVPEKSPMVYLLNQKPANTFSLTIWVKPTKQIPIDIAGSYSKLENFVIFPLHGGDENMGIGLSVGTNGISIYGHASNILEPLLTYIKEINDFVNITLNVSQDKTDLYVNGILVKSTNTLFPQKPKFIGDIISFNNSLYCDYFSGVVDELGMWDRNLTPSEIKQYYVDTYALIQTKDIEVVNGREFILPVLTDKLTITDSINTYQFKLNYDTTTLQYNSYSKVNTLSSAGIVNVNSIKKGQLVVGYIGSDYLEGTGALVNINFKAVGAGVSTPSIPLFYFNSDTIKHIEMGNVSVFTKYGDVNGDDLVLAHDAGIVLQYSVGLDPIPSIDLLPWDNWRKVAGDVDGNDTLNAYDAGLILQKSIELLDTFPVEFYNPTAQMVPRFDQTDVTITKEWDNLIVRSHGDIIGLNIEVKNGSQYFDIPNTYAESFINAKNIDAQNYKIGLASATPLSDNSILMVIPIKNEIPVEVTFNMMVNATPKSMVMKVATGLPDEIIPEVKLFINPTTNDLTINLGMNPAESINYRIVNLTGQTILNGELNKQTNIINLGYVLSGVYIVQILDGNNVVSVHKVIKE